MCKIKQLIKIHGQNLTKHEIEYLTEFEVKTINLYGSHGISKQFILEALK